MKCRHPAVIRDHDGQLLCMVHGAVADEDWEPATEGQAKAAVMEAHGLIHRN